MRSNDNEIFFPSDVVKLNLLGANLIRAWRIHHRLSQKQMAKKMDISIGTYRRFETREIKKEIYNQLFVDALGITLAHIKL